MISKFWEEVIEGYNQVAISQERQISISRDNKEATIAHAGESVMIAIRPAKTATHEPLIEP